MKNSPASQLGAIFQENSDGTTETFDMKDKIATLFEHFDRDKDGHLNYNELKSLQLQTSGADMTPDQYKHVCVMLDCHPDKGLSLNAIKLTYASEGASIDTDYEKVFPNKEIRKRSNDDGEDDVIEVGEGGVDISSWG